MPLNYFLPQVTPPLIPCSLRFGTTPGCSLHIRRACHICGHWNHYSPKFVTFHCDINSVGLFVWDYQSISFTAL